MSEDVVAELRADLEELAEVVRRLPAEQLELRPAEPQGWTARQVLAHLADFELMAAVRVRTVLSVDRPALASYGQEEFTDRFSALETAEEALERFEVNRRATLRVVAALAPADLERVGVHPQRGEEPLRRTLEMLARHDRAHLDQLVRAARAIGG
ncbi:MAG TPA: DinB family protein [Candidatus Dormibacteraeota bacterium]|nr:DinB family protein [Candidatus Dormibacteraeota bacterium]